MVTTQQTRCDNRWVTANVIAYITLPIILRIFVRISRNVTNFHNCQVTRYTLDVRHVYPKQMAILHIFTSSGALVTVALLGLLDEMRRTHDIDKRPAHSHSLTHSFFILILSFSRASRWPLDNTGPTSCPFPRSSARDGADPPSCTLTSRMTYACAHDLAAASRPQSLRPLLPSHLLLAP